MTNKLYKTLPEEKQPVEHGMISADYKPCAKPYVRVDGIYRKTPCGAQVDANNDVSCPAELCDLCNKLGAEEAIKALLKQQSNT